MFSCIHDFVGGDESKGKNCQDSTARFLDYDQPRSHGDGNCNDPLRN